MSDTDYEGPKLNPLPHPELLNLDVDATPEPAQPPPVPEPAPIEATAPAAEPDEPKAHSAAPAAPKPPASGQPLWQRIAYATGALVLYALLIDAAVEAVLSASPLQWWIVGTVGGFLVLSGLLWRPTGWGMKAGLAALTLLGLLAGVLWFTGDVNQGLTLLRQPSAPVLMLASGLLVGLAGIWLMTRRALPWWGKGVVGLMTVYGASAFLLPLLAAAGLPNLLDSVPVLERLPFWLQGQFVGVVILLPLALLTLLITGVTQVRGRKLWGWSFRVAAFALGLFIAFHLSAGVLPTLLAPEAAPPAPEPAAEPAPAQPEAAPAAPLQPVPEPETPSEPEPAPPPPSSTDKEA